MKKLVTICAVVIFALAMSAGAATVNYTVTGWGPHQYPAPIIPPAGAPWGVNGYPGDTLELVTYTGTLDLTPGTYNLQINTLKWTIDYTYGGTATDPEVWSNVLHNITAIRSISFDGGTSGSLSQTASLENQWENDFLTINEGTTSSFTVGGFHVNVTPLGVNQFGGTNFSGSNPWVQPDQNIIARFDVTVAVNSGSISTVDPAATSYGAVRFKDFTNSKDGYRSTGNLYLQDKAGYLGSGTGFDGRVRVQSGADDGPFWVAGTTATFSFEYRPVDGDTDLILAKAGNLPDGNPMTTSLSRVINDPAASVNFISFFIHNSPLNDTGTPDTISLILTDLDGNPLSPTTLSVGFPGGDYNWYLTDPTLLTNGFILSGSIQLSTGVESGESDKIDIAFGNIPEPACMFDLAGDLNDDCRVDFIDLKVFSEQWLLPPGLPSADIWPSGGDNTVNFQDFAVMAENWLIDCQASPSNPACVPK